MKNKVTWGKNQINFINTKKSSPAEVLYNTLKNGNLNEVYDALNNYGKELYDSLLRTRDNIDYLWVINIIYKANQCEINTPELNYHTLEDFSNALANIVGKKTVMYAMYIIKNSLRLSEHSRLVDNFISILKSLEDETKASETKELEENSASHPETAEGTQIQEQDDNIDANQHKDTSTNSRAATLETSEFDEHNNQNTEYVSLVKENKKETRDNTDDSAESTLIMNDVLSWIYSLPEDIQQYFFNTAYVQELLASLKEIHNISNPQNIADQFSQLFEAPLEELHKNTWKYNDEISPANELAINNKESDLTSLPDISMIFEGDISNMAMILPTIGSGYIGLEPNFINAMNYS